MNANVDNRNQKIKTMFISLLSKRGFVVKRRLTDYINGAFGSTGIGFYAKISFWLVNVSGQCLFHLSFPRIYPTTHSTWPWTSKITTCTKLTPPLQAEIKWINPKIDFRKYSINYRSFELIESVNYVGEKVKLLELRDSSPHMIDSGAM